MTTPHPRRWLILFVILAAECMDLLDGTVVNVGAPTIHADLHTSSTALQRIVGGYGHRQRLHPDAERGMMR